VQDGCRGVGKLERRGGGRVEHEVAPVV
jgi:hypothetical protein